MRPDEKAALGMKCLVDNFGIVDAEPSVYSARAERPDYTHWGRQACDGMTMDDVFRMAREDIEGNPFERPERRGHRFGPIRSFTYSSRGFSAANRALGPADRRKTSTPNAYDTGRGDVSGQPSAAIGCTRPPERAGIAREAGYPDRNICCHWPGPSTYGIMFQHDYNGVYSPINNDVYIHQIFIRSEEPPIIDGEVRSRAPSGTEGKSSRIRTVAAR
jgi:hypothetical protein